MLIILLITKNTTAISSNSEALTVHKSEHLTLSTVQHALNRLTRDSPKKYI